MERVYLHLATGGVDGRSAYLPADVTAVLQERGADAHLLGVSATQGLSIHGGMRMHLLVDGVPVYVDEHMAGNGVTCAVRFDASCVVPAYEPDVSRVAVPGLAWPKTPDEAETLVGRQVDFASYTVRCVSERTVADAVLTYVGIAKKMWPSEEEAHTTLHDCTQTV
jgi:hypothetical protein